MSEFGLVYCVTGAAYAQAAVLSYLSMPLDLPVCWICDDAAAHYVEGAIGESAGDIEVPDVSPELEGYQVSRYLKLVEAPSLSPFGTSLYVDCDTLCPQAALNVPLLQMLANFGHGFGLAINRGSTLEGASAHISPEELSYTAQLVPPNSIQFNGGVILWRSGGEASAIFDHWWDEYQRFGQADQAALTRSLQIRGQQVFELPQQFNFPSSLLNEAAWQIVDPQIVHCAGGMVESGQFLKWAQSIAPHAINRLEGINGHS